MSRIFLCMQQPGRRRAAAEVEARRGELGLNQDAFGIDASTYRAFVKGEHWPQPRTRAKIEIKLRWKIGKIAELAQEPVDDGLMELARATTNVDERYLLASSDIPETSKRSLIARLWSEAAQVPAESGEKAEDTGSQGT